MTPTTAQIRRYASDPVAFMEDLIIPAARGNARFGDVMAPEQRERFAALAPSLLALARGEVPPIGRFWVECVKGWSKTCDLAACFLWLASFAGRPIGSAQIAASDKDQAAESRKAGKDILHLNQWLGERVKIREWKIVCDATGFEAEIIAADEDGSHGGRPLLLWIDEVHAITKTDFLSNLLDNADKVEGVVICSTNAGFVGTPCWELREIARKSPRWKFLQITTPPKWVGAEKLAEAKLRNPHGRYMRLWWGVWSTGSDVLNDGVIEAAYAANVPMMREGSRDYAFGAGLDLSVSKDFSALVIVGKHNKTSRLRVAKCWLWKPGPGRKIDQEAIEETAYQAHKTFGGLRIAVDPYQGEYLISRLAKRGVKIESRPQTGKNLVDQCSLTIEQFNSLNIDIPTYPPLRTDLENLKIEERSYGFRLVGATTGGNGHSDLATATSIAIAVAKDAKPKKKIMVGGGSPPDDAEQDSSTSFGQYRPLSPATPGYRRRLSF